MRYFISAGEASGDIHGAQLISQLKALDPKARFVFLGGDNMAAQVGHDPVIHISDMAFMGFSQVLKNLGTVFDNLRQAKDALRLTHAHAVILIDYPDFNLKIAKEARRLGVPVFYYISPKVWAWKEWRVRSLKHLVTRMYSIFPFEVPFYKDRHQWDVTYVGNPSVDEIDRTLAALPSREAFMKKHNLPARQWIALLPGSRRGEINNNLPIMVEAAASFPQYRPVIAAAPSIDPSIYSSLAPCIPLVSGDYTALLAHSRAALVTSGTATLEAALAGTPQVACYRANGSKLSYNIMKKLLKVPFVTLPNLIANSAVIPEMLVHLCTADTVADALAAIISDTPARQQMLDGYANVRHILGTQNAPLTAAADIIRTLQLQP